MKNTKRIAQLEAELEKLKRESALTKDDIRAGLVLKNKYGGFILVLQYGWYSFQEQPRFYMAGFNGTIFAPFSNEAYCDYYSKLELLNQINRCSYEFVGYMNGSNQIINCLLENNLISDY